MNSAAEELAKENPEMLLGLLFSETKQPLQAVENRIRSVFGSEAPVLSEIPAYLLAQGGKRIRPTLALAVSRFFGEEQPSPQLVDAAAGIELIHMATLLHDDIIDQSPTRRHKPSAFRQYGMTPSLLAGDFLLVRAFGLCAKLDEFVITRTEQACVELTEGEVLEGKLSAAEPKTLPEYINIVAKKTASLFSLSAAVGSHYSTASPEEVDLLSQFGRYAGIAFQMVDDILDIVAEEDLLGKPSGTDLKQQTPSLVNILWLESGDKEALEFFSQPSISDEAARAAVEKLRGSEILTQARAVAIEFGEKAKSALNGISSGRCREPVRQQLLALVDYTLNRCW